MPRQARKHAESGIYHVMFRGIDRQLIFEDKQDYLFLLEIIRECKDICNFELYAYCLMGNHVHLLIKTLDDSLDTIMKRIAGRYVYWYNVKYKRGDKGTVLLSRRPLQDRGRFCVLTGADDHIGPATSGQRRDGSAHVRLRCPVCALARTPALHTDRGTHCACASSATGSAQARGPLAWLHTCSCPFVPDPL